MRSRYSHDGTVDPHAHHEHETHRRAEEGLERRRRDEHARKDAHLGTLPGMPGTPKAPELPHEQHGLPETLKYPNAATKNSKEHAPGWPVRPEADGAANSIARGHRR